MRHSYDIPRVQLRTARSLPWAAVAGTVVVLVAARHVWLVVAWREDKLVSAMWATLFAVSVAQWIVSWFERPVTVDAAQAESLARSRVTVCVPVFNEDAEVLDRVLYALFTQTRLPDCVEVVDDGSKVDYAEVREHWLAHRPQSVELTWVRQDNQGKKTAHALTFRRDLADIFVTLDSDTVLERGAIEEGIKPFADDRVQSVAGLELAWNHDWNLMTRLNSTRQLVWQLVTCSSQNVLGGNVLINRGTFALYRGDLIRSCLDGYLNESFAGRRIRLGDDTYLTLMALCKGRAVQQPSAVCLTMYPENLSHHLRQWTRWMRGTTLRVIWRLRYLRATSWAWWYTLLGTWWWVASLAMTVGLLAEWPTSSAYSRAMLAAGSIWALAAGSRVMVVRRSDQGPGARLGTLALAPLCAAWVFLVLRVIRVWGTFTFLRQGWTTRAEVEVRAELGRPATPPRPARAPATAQAYAPGVSQQLGDWT